MSVGGARVRPTKTFDAKLELKDAGLIVSTQACQVDAEDRILDLGSGSLEGDIVINVTACEVASDDEKYIISAEVSSEPDFSEDIYAVQSMILGAAGTAEGDNIPGDKDMGVGKYLMPFRNEIANGVPKQYMRLHVTVEGSVASGINFTAYLSKDE